MPSSEDDQPAHPDTGVTDAELVKLINQGGPTAREAFETLYRRHRDWCVRLARRHARHDEEALELVHDAFVVLLGRFPGFELTSKLTTFLYPVIVNRARDLQRREQRRWGKLRLVASKSVGEKPPAINADVSGEHAGVLAAVGDLPDAQREVVLMRVVDEMSVAEVAIALGVPEGTVKSRLHKGLGALRGAMGDVPGDDGRDPGR